MFIELIISSLFLFNYRTDAGENLSLTNRIQENVLEFSGHVSLVEKTKSVERNLENLKRIMSLIEDPDWAEQVETDAAILKTMQRYPSMNASKIRHETEKLDTENIEVLKNTPSHELQCPKADKAMLEEFPAECCSFPFTHNKQLYYQCTPDVNNGLPGCFIQKRKWVSCKEPSDYVAQNKTETVTIPLVARFTAVSVHNWIVFQQRVDGSVSFNRSWSDYKVGFGNYSGNFWMGLEKIHRVTTSGQYMLRIEALLINGTWISAEYDNFIVKSESANYTFNLSGYSGDGSRDAGSSHNGYPFSTYDRDNDIQTTSNCAISYLGGWWYYNCWNFILNAPYLSNQFTGAVSTSRMMMKRI